MRSVARSSTSAGLAHCTRRLGLPESCNPRHLMRYQWAVGAFLLLSLHTLCSQMLLFFLWWQQLLHIFHKVIAGSCHCTAPQQPKHARQLQATTGYSDSWPIIMNLTGLAVLHWHCPFHRDSWVNLNFATIIDLWPCNLMSSTSWGGYSCHAQEQRQMKGG